MAELADAYDSGSYFRKEVQVQFLLPAPTLKAFVYAALSVFLSWFSTEMTDINKADSKRIRLLVNSWGKELKWEIECKQLLLGICLFFV